jgi:pyruvate/2-oxoglutarate dehydrogenase complex dihydrolipoamide dehydrogenase (E3) component
VTIVEAASRLLPREDPEMAQVVEGALRDEGVALHAGAAIERVEARRAGGVALVIRNGAGSTSIEGTHLLVAAGRRPTTEGLDLDAAGIAIDGNGVVVDRRLLTANRRVYAIGDCAGGEAAGARFTHVANHHAGLVIRNALFRLPVRIDRTPIPRVTFTAPELASVGLSEEEAKARDGTVRVLRWPVAENDRARTERATRGHIKAVVSARGTILGCAIVAPRAGDLIVPWVLCMARNLKVQHLAGLVFPYPTTSEISKRAAVEFLRPSAQNPWLRRLMGLVRRLG